MWRKQDATSEARFAQFLHYAGLSLLFFACCTQYVKYNPDPEKDIDRWITNFSLQKSFSYEYEMRVISVRVKAAGECMIGKGEKLAGQWRSDGEVRDFEYVGLGDLEYSRKNGAWEKAYRGEQSDVFAQIERILSFGKFQYKGFEDGFWYGFKANVPFLAPDRRKEMIGMVKISADDYLPEFIWAGLPDSSSYWTGRMFKYNRDKNIESPGREYGDYLAVPTETSQRDYYRQLKTRLDMINIDYRVRKTDRGILLSVPIHERLEDMRAMLSPGGLAIYGVVGERNMARKTGYLRNNMREPVYLSGVLYTEDDIRDAEIKFDQRSTPYISLRFRERRKMPQVIAFEIDSVLVATAALDTLKTLDRIRLYPEMQYRDVEILRAQIVQPLGALELRPAGGALR
jgi:hypothetical protein